MLPGPNALLGFCSPFTRAWEFAAGALLAFSAARWRVHSRGLMTTLGLTGLGLVMASVLLIGKQTPFPGPWTLLPVIGALLLIASGSGQTTLISRMLSTPSIARVGDWSYSIYLWHWPLIVFAGVLWGRLPTVLFGAALLSVIPAIASYRWVEQPIRNFTAPRGRRLARLVAVTVAPALVLATALAYCAANGWWLQSVRRLQAAAVPQHIASIDGCTDRRPLGSDQLRGCEWHRDAAGKPVYLVGDSHAGHFSEGAIEAAGLLNRPIFVAAAWGCPFVGAAFEDAERPDSVNESCRLYFQGTLQYLRHAEPGLVVIANNNDWYWFDRFRSEAGLSKEAVAQSASLTQSALADGLRRTVETLRSAGHRVLLVQTAPRWTSETTSWDPSRCTLMTVVRHKCVAGMPLARMVDASSAARQAVADAARGAGAAIWDPGPPLCPDGLCSTDGPGFTRYRDGSHLSVQQSTALAPDLVGAIASAERDS